MVVALSCVHFNKNVSATTYVLGIEGGSGEVPTQWGIPRIGTTDGNGLCRKGPPAPPGSYVC
jgi:hypothetical protein